MRISIPFILFVVLISRHEVSFGQEHKMSINKNRLAQEEKQDDPYLPNAFDNKRVSPAYKYCNQGKNTTSTLITTTQVNVDALGQNIGFDAANEPGIAVNPLNANEIVIGWRQFDNVSSNFRQAGWAYTNDGGLTWTFPGVIEPGIFHSDPVVDFDRFGNFYYNSLTNITGAYTCKVFESTNGGVNWNAGIDAQGGDKQWMAIDRTLGVGSGNIYSFWTASSSSCPPYNFTRLTNSNGFFEPCITADGDPYWGTMAVNNSGDLFISSGGFLDSLIVIKSINAQIPGSTITWDTAVVFMDGNVSGFVPMNPVGILGQTNIDVDRSNGPGAGNVYLMASLQRISNFDPADVMFVRSTDGGVTWSNPIQINDDISSTNTNWFGTMSVAPNGRIDVIWLDTRDNPGLDNSALYYSYSTDQGNTWSINEKLSNSFDPHVGYPNQDKMGDYYDMVSDNIGAHLSWANTLNGEQDVYYSHIVPPIPININSITEDLSIAVYPNPTAGTFTVANTERHYQIEIYSLLGENIYLAASDNSKSTVDISTLNSGIYFMKVINKNGATHIKKIIKE